MHALIRALLNRKISALVAICYTNERPLAGLAGAIDWCFHGILSHYIHTGNLTGSLGEMIYCPQIRAGQLYSILLLGQGETPQYGKRHSPSPESYPLLSRHLTSLKFTTVGISKEDFGQLNPKILTQHFQKINLWMSP